MENQIYEVCCDASKGVGFISRQLYRIFNENGWCSGGFKENRIKMQSLRTEIISRAARWTSAESQAGIGVVRLEVTNSRDSTSLLNKSVSSSLQSFSQEKEDFSKAFPSKVYPSISPSAGDQT